MKKKKGWVRVEANAMGALVLAVTDWRCAVKNLRPLKVDDSRRTDEAGLTDFLRMREGWADAERCERNIVAWADDLVRTQKKQKKGD